MTEGWLSVVVAVTLVAITAGAIWFDRSRQVPLPAIGVFDWSDVVFLTVVVIGFPLLQYVEPLWLAEALTGLMITVSIADLARGLLPARPVVRRTIIVMALCSCIAMAFFGDGSLLNAVAGDLLLVPFIAVGAIAWAQLGMRIDHLMVVLLFLTVYDIVATPLSQFMGPLSHRLAAQQPPLIFAVPSTHGVALLGIGDVLIAVLVPLVVRRHFGARAGWVAVALCVAAYLSGLSIALRHPGVTIPLMVTLTPAAMLAIAFGSRRSVRRSNRVRLAPCSNDADDQGRKPRPVGAAGAGRPVLVRGRGSS